MREASAADCRGKLAALLMNEKNRLTTRRKVLRAAAYTGGGDQAFAPYASPPVNSLAVVFAEKIDYSRPQVPRKICSRNLGLI